MKKIIFLSILALINIYNVKCCDVCGCGISNGFSNILPQFNKNFIGVRSSYARNNAFHDDNHLNINFEKSLSTELWGRFYLSKKIQLIAVVPYLVKSQKENAITTQTRGLGDASLNINYTLINTNADSLKWKHLLLAGGGIKLPTGKYNTKTDRSIYMQPGTGSFDYLFDLLYTLRYKKIGFSNNIQYRINNENKNQYALGNRFTLNSRVFYWKNINYACNVLPYLGFLTEIMDKDYKNNYVQAETGGYLNSLTIGCEVYMKSFLFSCSYSAPVKQNLSDGQVRLLSKFQLNTGFLF